MKSFMVLVALSALLAVTPPGFAAKRETAMDNTWGSEARFVDDDTVRITTRKRVAGDLEEINKPGTTVYNTFQNVQNITLLRAALECKQAGYDLFRVTGTRDITQQRDRNRVSGNVKEEDFTFAPGHYTAEIDLGIQVTVDLLAGPMPDPRPDATYSADEILIANGIVEPAEGQKPQ